MGDGGDGGGGGGGGNVIGGRLKALEGYARGGFFLTGRVVCVDGCGCGGGGGLKLHCRESCSWNVLRALRWWFN